MRLNPYFDTPPSVSSCLVELIKAFIEPLECVSVVFFDVKATRRHFQFPTQNP